METLYKKIEEVKEEMTKNVKQVLDRNDNLDTLNKTSEDLKKWAEIFEWKTGKVAQSYCWKRAKLITVIVVVVLIIILIVILLATGVIPVNIHSPPVTPTSKP
ncbi:vesicle-associated membrane protein 8-like [Sphaeramia orbicularis]|uniref:vesicle-associated membrane protein 8-like n=1 Tax=Sphaeramia orbicularis TaxID=375764 RepID=UPI00117C42DF|nr:vesicle-associated membrane protein 8-like [Sphaeramia orbicularis]